MESMGGSGDSFYAQARVRCGVVPVLHEDDDSPPERLLQSIWGHQRLLRDQLKTLDGQPVRVLHPGFHNLEGGPDFRGAIVQFGGGPHTVGDIEVDLRASGWRAHGHDHNPAFRQVILQVTWQADPPHPQAPPALSLRGVLDAPLGELSHWLGGEGAPEYQEGLRGRCCAQLRAWPKPLLQGLLREAAQVRLRSKAAQFQARARQVGWGQSLWEGLFRALGYKHNVWPMQRLGELRPRWHCPGAPVQALQARLLGLSGLLPEELTRKQIATDTYLRRVWDQWWRERDEYSDAVLPRSAWRLHGLRPANHPHRRLALAAGWAVARDLPGRLDRWCTEPVKPAHLPSSLLEILLVEPDEFWARHWTLRSTRLPKAQPLLGATRVTDLAINVVLPWLWSRACEGQNEALRKQLEDRYYAWPPGEDNSLLRLARQRLLAGGGPRSLTGAASQQGLLQIVRDFCDHSNALCDACQFPELLQGKCVA
jgi:hypothetical protein